MSPYRFIIIGSGWRSLYYVRIAKALPELFSLEMMYCRTEEKAKRIAEEWQIPVTVSEDECVRADPDFIVNAVSKDQLAAVSLSWLEKGFTVLQETPAATDMQMLNELWRAHQKGHKLVIAEQYTRYPSNAALLNILREGLIGERDLLYLSAAHEYHGAALMRAFLDIPQDMPFSVTARSVRTSVVRTLTRTERFTDGQEKTTGRTIAVFQWANGKTALYDFDGEQYHSPIRNNMIRIQGRRGEILNDSVTYLDPKFTPVQARIEVQSHTVHTGEDNPHFASYPEIDRILLDDRIYYEQPFGAAGLSEDETAIALLMQQTGEYARGKSSSPYPLQEALTDAYTAILLRQSLACDKQIESQPQIWQEGSD